MPDPIRDERVAAVVIADADVTEEAVRAHCATSLAEYKRPEIIAFEDQLPRTSVGKVRKHVLVQRLQSSRDVMGATYGEPARTLPVVDDCDVLVVGGGAAGIAAAVGAAREGAETVLVERYGSLGGMATGGLVILLLTLDDGRGTTVVRGICEEVVRRLDARGVAVHPAAGELGSRRRRRWWTTTGAGAWSGAATRIACATPWPTARKPCARSRTTCSREAGARLRLHSLVAAPIARRTAASRAS